MGIGESASATAKALGTAVTTGVTVASLAANVASPYVAADQIAAPADEDNAIVAQAEDNPSAASGLYVLDQWAGDDLDNQFEQDYENNVMADAEQASDDADIVADFSTSQNTDLGEIGDFGSGTETDGFGVLGDLGGDFGGDMAGEGGM